MRQVRALMCSSAQHQKFPGRYIITSTLLLQCACCSPQVCELAHLSNFYGTPRLSGLCEQYLAALLPGHDSQPTASQPAPHELAPQLLQLADNAGLAQLKRVTLSWIAGGESVQSSGVVFNL
jgi:hypothetical protein